MIENFRYLLLIRLLSLTGIGIVFVYLNIFASTSLPLVPICIIIFISLVITLWSWLKLKKQNNVSKNTFFSQLLFDIVTLSILIYYSGGSANPLISLFIIPIIFSAASLPRRYTWSLTFMTIISYTTLMFFQVPLINHHQHDETVNLHLWGMWYGFILSAFLIAYFVSRISSNLREYQHLLAKAREASLRNEQIVALGTLAANTAHELGTPLSTMAILTSELENEYSNQDKELVSDLTLLKTQISRCKSIISNMAKDAGELQADTGIKKSLKKYLNELIDEWENSLVNIEVIKQFVGKNSSPNIVVDRSLTYALTNILINSAQASPTKIVITADWNEQEFSVVIKDDGHGIDKNILARIGNNIVSGTGIEKGMGIGLFLAKTTIDRFGGELLINSEKDGTMIKITIPLLLLLTDASN
jgi:two-component system, sensor histidine kinase RegB